jgi:archaellum component FlaC
MSSDDSELLAQQVSGLNEKVNRLEQRMADVEKVNSRLEQAALTTACALQEISGHWDAVYEAMRRAEKIGSDVERDAALGG